MIKRPADITEVCRRFNQAMLVACSEDGMLWSRPLLIASVNLSEFWFAANLASLPREELRSHPEVCITMSGGGDYVSITGEASIATHAEKIEELWSDSWRGWFPAGKWDASLGLIRVEAKLGEFWLNAGTYRIKHLFAAARDDIGSHRAFTAQGQCHSLSPTP